MKKEKILKNSKAITLIALVITIIILLILAGVTISTLTGDNGLLTNAKEAVKKTREAQATEELKMKIMEAKTALIDKDSDAGIKEIAEYFEKTESEIEIIIEYLESASVTIIDNGIVNPVKARITYENYEFVVDNDGNIDESRTVEVGENLKTVTAQEIFKNPSAYYGKKVTNYTANNGFSDWQIFCSYTGNIYLIASDYIGKEYIPDTNKDSIKLDNRTMGVTPGYSFSLTNAQQYYNYTKHDDLFSSTAARYWLGAYNQYTNYIPSTKAWAASGYLLDENVWNSFGNTTKSDFAMGAPTIELLSASYNAYQDKKGTNSSISYIADSKEGYKIKWNNDLNYSTGISGLDKTELNKLYVGNNAKAQGMWLATAVSGSERYLFTVTSSGLITSCDCYDVNSNNYAVGFRPVVCLKQGETVQIRD